MRVCAGKPASIGEYVTLDLTRDVLGASSRGYVIRTTCSENPATPPRPCVLKRTQAMDDDDDDDDEPPDLAKLSHENVVELLHYWTEEKTDLFLAMELMDGDLALLMGGASPFSLSVAVDVMVQVAKGMQHLHERGVAHPHLKCEHVLYKQTGAGDVVVKVGGFRCSRRADAASMTRDVVCFGYMCLELLTGAPDVARVPDTTPALLRDCILRCLQTPPPFSEVVASLLQAKSLIMQTCGAEMVCWSAVANAESTETMTEEFSSACISNGEMFAIHELHSELGESSTSVPVTLVFFHGFHKAPEEWRRTWMTRNNKLVWAQTWLPEHLGAENIRVLSVSFDAHSSSKKTCNRYEMGKRLVQALVLSSKWKLGEGDGGIFLIGHSFGGVLIKSLVTEACHVVRSTIEAGNCEKFLKRLTSIVFYSVPTGLEFERFISGCRNLVALQGSSFLQSLEGDAHLIADMEKLSSDFESSVPAEVTLLAFLEGKPMNKKHVLVTERSCEGRWEWHKIDEDNHFEVCRPTSKSHTGYRILVDHLRKQLSVPCSSVLGKRQVDDVFIASAGGRPLGKRLSFREEGSSRSSNFSIAPSALPTSSSTPPAIDSDTPRDHNSREVVRDAQITVQSTSDSQLKPLPSDPSESGDPLEIDSQVQAWEGSSSQWSFYASQLDQEP